MLYGCRVIRAPAPQMRWLLTICRRGSRRQAAWNRAIRGWCLGADLVVVVAAAVLREVREWG